MIYRERLGVLIIIKKGLNCIEIMGNHKKRKLHIKDW